MGSNRSNICAKNPRGPKQQGRTGTEVPVPPMKIAAEKASAAHDGHRHPDSRFRRNACNVHEDRERNDRAAAAESAEGNTDQDRQKQRNCFASHLFLPPKKCQ